MGLRKFCDEFAKIKDEKNSIQRGGSYGRDSAASIGVGLGRRTASLFAPELDGEWHSKDLSKIRRRKTT